MRIKKKHQGIRPYRYKDNPLEKRFAFEWQKENERTIPSLLAHIVSNDQNPFEPTQDCRTLSSTIIQWLGTHVGQCFLEIVLRSREGRRFLKNRMGVKKIDEDEYDE